MITDSETVPLDDTFNETIEHHGRLYQQYAIRNRTYFVPIDDEEMCRLEAQHAVLCKIFDQRLVFPPVAAPSRILDCGCGAGDWAVDVANQFPDAEIIGLDVSPHMLPEYPPDNLELQVDDLNGRLTFPSDHFDIVHSQMVCGGINKDRWRGYVRDIIKILRPGGWCQMVEVYLNAQSDNGSLTPENALSRWSSAYLSAVQPYKDPRAPLRLADWMRIEGFTEIESKLVTLPMCGWSTVARDQDIGASNLENVKDLLYSIGLYPMTGLQRMSLEDFETLVEEARIEAGDVSLKAYFPLYVCIGRKPIR